MAASYGITRKGGVTGGHHGTIGGHGNINNPSSSANDEKDNDAVTPEPDIKFADIRDETRDAILATAKQTFLLKKKGELLHWKDCAEMMKKEMDEKEGGTWHCIVGTHFGSFVSHESHRLIYFSVGNMKVLLYKHG